ncbi:hypothetical protein DUNSADRAFT_897 [Dunaliella salina]|uniref:Ycf49-like protein n=1 Tax=Dunaliella salina TaxID=3046 RepID=A0ABQ7H8N6_DUNSA|nr:hypothetical protein DUNSADRAFT_897 [Dunaliella salina]|eukprot:KAF5843221.1 hypothetical protein DUNSADRAFT_897 [Dunaliella salina]
MRTAAAPHGCPALAAPRHLLPACSHTAVRCRRAPSAHVACSNSSTHTSNADSSSSCQGEGHQPSLLSHSVPRTAPLTLPAYSAALALAFPDASQAIATEPSNALSLPTWAIHVSCVIEWATAMSLLWQYAEVSGNPRWKGLAWGLLPCFGSAMCACTWHFFYNAPEMEYLVALQAFLTLVGNTTCMVAGYRIWSDARAEKSQEGGQEKTQV